MMKTAPSPSFKVIQTQVVLGALEELFNLPAGTTQPQTASPAGRLMKVGQGVVIRFGLVGGPVHHEPRACQFLVPFSQLVLQIDLAPSQAGGAGLAVGRPPSARFPFPG